jgi:hypothetical protein
MPARPQRVFENEDDGGVGPNRTPQAIDARLRKMERRLIAVIASLNGATIECDPDDSTITLTFPDLPSS